MLTLKQSQLIDAVPVADLTPSAPTDDEFAKLIDEIIQSYLKLFGASQVSLGLFTQKKIKWIASSSLEIKRTDIETRFIHKVLQDETAVFFSKKARLLKTNGLFPLIYQRELIGVIWISSEKRGFFTDKLISSIRSHTHWVTKSFYYAKNLILTNQTLEKYKILSIIGNSILSPLSLHAKLSEILDQILRHLRIDAADILLLDTKNQALDFYMGSGFHVRHPQTQRTSIYHSLAGESIQSREILICRDIHQDRHILWSIKGFETEEFYEYIAIPLVTRDEPQGVLELFFRRQNPVDAQTVNLLELIANQIATAIDISYLVQSLDQQRIEITLAYNSTIEGLSRALELRDRETQGHTRRVARLTLQLAQKLGITSEDLIHIQRGAMLHDIGKVGVPDAILLKPGSLTAKEWEIMRQHPLFAQNIISQIDYLKPALDIPVYHHERWDGRGYPHGLKGLQIPLAARIFSIIDVYDALTSDRPYRTAWSKEQALEYIRRQAGKYFDPQITDEFLLMASELR